MSEIWYLAEPSTLTSMPVMVPHSRSSCARSVRHRGENARELDFGVADRDDDVGLVAGKVAVPRLSGCRMPNSSSALSVTAWVATKVVMRQPRPLPNPRGSPAHASGFAKLVPPGIAPALQAHPIRPRWRLRRRRKRIGHTVTIDRHDSPIAHAHARGRPRHSPNATLAPSCQEENAAHVNRYLDKQLFVVAIRRPG